MKTKSLKERLLLLINWVVCFLLFTNIVAVKAGQNSSILVNDEPRLYVESQNLASGKNSFDLVNSSKCDRPVELTCERFCIRREAFCANIRRISDHEWQLEIFARKETEITKIAFPYQLELPWNPSLLNDYHFYYPFIGGIRESLSNTIGKYRNFGVYPGGLFSPYVIRSNANEAEILFATNSPPRVTAVGYAAEFVQLEYHNGKKFSTQWPRGIRETPQGGEIAFYKFRYKKIQRSRDTPGLEPWHLATDYYRSWLVSKFPVKEEPSTPFLLGHGLLTIQLQNRASEAFVGKELDALLRYWGKHFPRLIVWGQMSDYGGGCCSLSYETPENRKHVLALVKKKVSEAGVRLGLYSAPMYDRTNNPNYTLGSLLGQRWIGDWSQFNIDDHQASVLYIDTLGRRPWGRPADLNHLLRRLSLSLSSSSAKAIQSTAVPDLIIYEGAIDIVPGSMILDGALTGADFLSAKGQGTEVIAFPDLAFFTMPTHAIHLGGLNADWKYSGPTSSRNRKVIAGGDFSYHAQRQAFLFGARLTGTNLLVRDAVGGWLPDPIIVELVDERLEANFFTRAPVYRGKIGLSDVSNRVEASVFELPDRKAFIAVVNWGATSGQSLKFLDSRILLPSRRFSLIEVERGVLN